MEVACSSETSVYLYHATPRHPLYEWFGNFTCYFVCVWNCVSRVNQEHGCGMLRSRAQWSYVLTWRKNWQEVWENCTVRCVIVYGLIFAEGILMASRIEKRGSSLYCNTKLTSPKMWSDFANTSKPDAKEGVWPIPFITLVFQSQDMPAGTPLSSVTDGCMWLPSLSICCYFRGICVGRI